MKKQLSLLILLFMAMSTMAQQESFFNRFQILDVGEPNFNGIFFSAKGSNNNFLIIDSFRSSIKIIQVKPQTQLIKKRLSVKFNDFDVVSYGFSDTFFWHYNKEFVNNSEANKIYTYEINQDSIIERVYNLPKGETWVSNVIVRNDSLFSIEIETSSDNNKQSVATVRMNHLKSTNEVDEHFIKTIDLPDIEKVQDRYSIHNSDSINYLLVEGTFFAKAVLVEFNARSLHLSFRKINNRFNLFLSGDKSLKGVYENDRLIVAEALRYSTQESVKKHLLGGIRFDDNQWFYSDEADLMRRDSLETHESRMFDPTIAQMPNGDYVSTVNVFEEFPTFWFQEKLGYQRCVLKVFSPGFIPKLKAAYIYEFPDGSLIQDIYLLDDESILLVGSANYGSSTFYPFLLNIGNGSSVGINQPNKPNERLKFSLNDSQSLLRIHHQDVQNLEIFDEWGRQVAQSNEQSIDIAHLAQGLYIVRTKTQNGQSRQANFIKSL